MLFILRFITQLRFSYLDYLWLSAFLVLFMQHRILLAFTAFIIGILFSVYMERLAQSMAEKKQGDKDQPWKDLADLDLKINAIKCHREIYGSSLKEAHDAVREYMGAKW